MVSSVASADSPMAILAAGQSAAPSVTVGKDENTSNLMARHMTPELVKGWGHKTGGQALTDVSQIMPLLSDAQNAVVQATRAGFANPHSMINKAAPEVGTILSRLVSSSPQNQAMAQWAAQASQTLSAAIGKDISLTSPLSTGFVPFDLVAPAKLIYPMFSPMRNRIPRVKGQGTSRRAKLITGFPGTQTAGNGYANRVSMAEFPGGGSFANWPLQLPASETETAVDLNVGYKFFGLTEPISWLAEFAGQGFQDISALANLLLLQKFMMAEEYQLIGSSSTNFSAPSYPTLVARTAVAGETPLTGVTTSVYVFVTGVGYYGQTAYGGTPAVSGVNVSAGQVVDVYIAPTAGAMQYNIFVGTGASNPGRTALYQYLNANAPVGGSWGAHAVTLQGALPTTTSNPPATDSGTGATTDYDGIVSILSGHASSTYSVAAGVYNASAYTTATVNIINQTLASLWNATKADPSDIIFEGTDLKRLSDDIRTTATNQAYRLFVSQSELSDVIAGAAVSTIVNPITRKDVQLQVHPWLPQGNALFMSYTIPFPYAETSNVWEMVLPQDYLSIAWPVVDVTYRYSLLLYGALVNYAPIYNGLLQGLQQTGISNGVTTPPFS